MSALSTGNKRKNSNKHNAHSSEPDDVHVMTLDEMANAIPQEPVEPAPSLNAVEPVFTLYAPEEPELSTKQIAPDKWAVHVRSPLAHWHIGLPVDSCELIEPRELLEATRNIGLPNGFRPPWMGHHYLPRILPRQAAFPILEGGLKAGPHERELITAGLVAAELADRNWPWCTVGRIIVRVPGRLDEIGTGVLVGPNLILTASHAIPWGVQDWSMEFIPALRDGDPKPRPFGSSFVEIIRGIPTEKDDVHGRDYVICKLRTALGNQVGWMGSYYFFNDNSYGQFPWLSVGYPGYAKDQPVFAPDLRIVDVDSDGDGRELETRQFLPGGWSGGPLWGWFDDDPKVIGIASGNEEEFSLGWFHVTEEHSVFAGGQHMVDLVKYGYANWPA